MGDFNKKGILKPYIYWLKDSERLFQHVEENLTYDYLHSSEDNLWSILYLTGYLTQARIDNLPDG